MTNIKNSFPRSNNDGIIDVIVLWVQDVMETFAEAAFFLLQSLISQISLKEGNAKRDNTFGNDILFSNFYRIIRFRHIQ